MEKYAVLLGYFDKQMAFVKKIYEELISINLEPYADRYLFAMRAQQFYTALEDLMKQIAKSFENQIENMGNFHKELLSRMNTEIPKIRPLVISQSSLQFLDKIRSFRHFIRHAYDCELNQKELIILQERFKKEYPDVQKDLAKFRSFINSLV